MKTPEIVTLEFDTPEEMDAFLADVLAGKESAHQRLAAAAQAQVAKPKPMSLGDVLQSLRGHTQPDISAGLQELAEAQEKAHAADAQYAAGKNWPPEAAQTAGYQKPVEPQVLPTGRDDRKAIPLARCLFDYFPAALAEVARISYEGNKQHNGNSEPFWAYDKSMDEADCLLRHFAERGTVDSDGLSHSAKVAWRALALLQRELTDSGRAPMPRAARYTKGEAKAGPTPPETDRLTPPEPARVPELYPMTDAEQCDQLYRWHKEGAAARRNGTGNPYRANTVAYYAHSGGWLQEDLRQALIQASPKYAASQRGRP
jgi:hypothetical protein